MLWHIFWSTTVKQMQWFLKALMHCRCHYVTFFLTVIPPPGQQRATKRNILHALTGAWPSSKRKWPAFKLPVFVNSMANLEHAEEDPKRVKMSADVSAINAPEQPALVSSVPGRDAGALPCSIPSFAAASELLSAPYSCLVINTHRRHISLPPMYLNKKKTGIQEELHAELLKFSQRWKHALFVALVRFFSA